MAVPKQPTVEYIDRPDLEEAFVDLVRYVTFDGATVRVELGVTRFEEPVADTPAHVKQYPVARLVLRPDAAVDLAIRLQRLIALMEQRGIIKREQPKNAPANREDVLQNPLGSGTGASEGKA